MQSPPAYDWSGGYADVPAGNGSADIADLFNDSAGETRSDSLVGLLGGGQIGYNWQIDNLVLGLEGSFTWAGFDEGSLVNDDIGAGANLTSRTGVDWLAALTPRFGFAFDNVLLYGKGGLALAAGSEEDVAAGLRFTEDSSTEVGWTVGAGAAVALSENWVIGVEGDYYDFGTYAVDKDIAAPPGPSQPVSDHDADSSLWSLLARLSYRFGGE